MLQDGGVVDVSAIEIILENVSPLLKFSKIFLDNVNIVVGQNNLEVVEW